MAAVHWLIWFKDVGGDCSDGDQGRGSCEGVALALLLVNLGQSTLRSYKLLLATLPPAFVVALVGKDVRVRDVWAHEDVAGTVDISILTYVQY